MATMKIPVPSKAELAAGLDKTKAALSSVRSGASELRQNLKKTQEELDKLREEPYVDAAVGVAIAVGGGAVAGAADYVLPPLFNIGGTEEKKTVDAEEVIVYKGGVNITASAVGGAGLVVLGVMDKSKSIMDAGKASLAFWSGSQSQRVLSTVFAK